MWASAFALLGLLPGSWAFEVPEQFLSDLRCPFARVWLEHGPEKAGELLGVAPHAVPSLGRSLATASSTWGSCSYRQPMPPPGQDLCVEMRGDSWTQSTASSRCTELSGTLAEGGTCAVRESELAGWCSMREASEFMPMHVTAGSNCTSVASACQMWSQGVFMPVGQCNVTTQSAGPAWSPARCTIAPGAIGAAHQLAMSPGYSVNCEGTPAQQSPYMWPLRWTAMVKDESMEFGSDEVKYESRGKVWYMLDRNWKRGDTWFRKGIQRTIGQSPCSTPVAGQSNACNRTGSYNSTVLHRNNKMVFIDWAEDGSIKNCSWLDMSVIGNIRPDWFMDNRGDSTDVQYLGDSHVYWRGQPKLVKQWRKKDFASQYFTMSMQRLPGPDQVNWPLILNVPGEGFGDDHLRQMWGHSLLDENDTAPFLLDEEYVRNGGSCPQRGGGGAAASGPPTSQVDPVPSNLDVDPAAWVTRVWTGSPVWTPPAEESSTTQDFTKTVAQGVEVASCFDVGSSTLQLTLTIARDTPVWAAVGFRGDSECLMTPRGGGDGEILYADPAEDGSSYTVAFGPMSPSIKAFQDHAVAAFMGRLQPLSEVAAMDSGSAGFGNGKVTLQFARRYQSRPSIFNLSYAYGREQKLGYHASRGCFTVTPVTCPVCNVQPAAGAGSEAGAGDSLVAGSRANSLAFCAWALTLLLASRTGLQQH